VNVVYTTHVEPLSKIGMLQPSSCLGSQITPNSSKTVTLYFVIFVITNVVLCAICILYTHTQNIAQDNKSHNII